MLSGRFPPGGLAGRLFGTGHVGILCTQYTLVFCFGVWGFGVFVQVPAALVALLITRSANLANLHQIHLGHPGHLGRVYL